MSAAKSRGLLVKNNRRGMREGLGSGCEQAAGRKR